MTPLDWSFVGVFLGSIVVVTLIGVALGFATYYGLKAIRGRR